MSRDDGYRGVSRPSSTVVSSSGMNPVWLCDLNLSVLAGSKPIGDGPGDDANHGRARSANRVAQTVKTQRLWIRTKRAAVLCNERISRRRAAAAAATDVRCWFRNQGSSEMRSNDYSRSRQRDEGCVEDVVDVGPEWMRSWQRLLARTARSCPRSSTRLSVAASAVPLRGGSARRPSKERHS